jgi:hypothetical protein
VSSYRGSSNKRLKESVSVIQATLAQVDAEWPVAGDRHTLFRRVVSCLWWLGGGKGYIAVPASEAGGSWANAAVDESIDQSITLTT